LLENHYHTWAGVLKDRFLSGGKIVENDTIFSEKELCCAKKNVPLSK